MRETIIIILILTIIIVGAVITQNFLNKTADLVVGKLNKLKESIKQENTEEDIRKQTEDVYNSWEKVNEKWSTIVLHDEIDLIETSLVKMKSGIESGDYDDSIRELDTSIFLLNHIKEKEKLCLKNIF